MAAVLSMAAITAGCGSESTSSTVEPSTTSTEPLPPLPQADGLVLVEPQRPVTDDLTIAATGLPYAHLDIQDGCITALLENGQNVTLHFFDGYGGFDGTTLFLRPFGQPESVAAEFQDGDPIGITGYDATPALDYIIPPPSTCPSEGTVVYSITRN